MFKNQSLPSITQYERWGRGVAMSMGRTNRNFGRANINILTPGKGRNTTSVETAG